ncbi:MAG: ADP-ribosylglycohydrolase family protein [Methermicoccaceae archaeon]
MYKQLKKRAVGCLLGIATGDALGEPFEGMHPDEVPPVDGLEWKPEVTDDTILSMITLESILNCGRVDKQDIVRRMLEVEINRIGPTTKLSLERYLQDPSYVPSGGTTNGAAMRAPVMGLLFSEPSKVVMSTITSSLVTHGSSIAIQGACAVACAVWACTMEREPVSWGMWGAKRAEEWWIKNMGGYKNPASSSPPMSSLINSSVKADSYENVVEIFGGGIETAESVPCVFYLVANVHSFREAVTTAAFHGGDSDTIASITGAIIGARDGVSTNPWAETVKAVLRWDVEDMADRIVKFRFSS